MTFKQPSPSDALLRKKKKKLVFENPQQPFKTLPPLIVPGDTVCSEIGDLYKPLRVLGIGGFGTVLLVEIIATKEKRAIKIQFLVRKRVLNNFLGEIRIATIASNSILIAQISPAVLKTWRSWTCTRFPDGKNQSWKAFREKFPPLDGFEAFVKKRDPFGTFIPQIGYIESEFAVHGDLKDRINEKIKYDKVQTKDLAFGILHGLTALWEYASIQHRDLQPSNILLVDINPETHKNWLYLHHGEPYAIQGHLSYRPVISDFGQSEMTNLGELSAPVTQMYYRAPELFFVAENTLPLYTHTADVFSLGVVFAELFSRGNHPFLQYKFFIDSRLPIVKLALQAEINNLCDQKKFVFLCNPNVSRQAEMIVYYILGMVVALGLPPKKNEGISESSILYKFIWKREKLFNDLGIHEGKGLLFENGTNTTLVQLMDTQGINLLKWMLSYSPKSRPLSSDAIKHSYFATMNNRGYLLTQTKNKILKIWKGTSLSKRKRESPRQQRSREKSQRIEAHNAFIYSHKDFKPTFIFPSSSRKRKNRLPPGLTMENMTAAALCVNCANFAVHACAFCGKAAYCCEQCRDEDEIFHKDFCEI